MKTKDGRKMNRNKREQKRVLELTLRGSSKSADVLKYDYVRRSLRKLFGVWSRGKC